MKNEVIARPYARALFELAQKEGKEARIAQDLVEVVGIWDDERQFCEWIRRPEVPVIAKHDAVKRLFGSIDVITQHFLAVIVDNSRETLLSAINEEYRKLWDASRHIMHVEVTAAKKLPRDQKEALTRVLGRATGKTVEIAIKEDTALIGGLTVRIGDRVLDGSLSRRLTVLGDRLKSGHGGGNVVEH